MNTAAPDARRRVYVISGSRGIGAAIVRALAGAGYDLVFTTRNPVGPAAEVLREITASNPDGTFRMERLDVCDRGELDRFASAIEADEGMYGLVYNPGQLHDALAANVDMAQAEELMQVNFFGLMRLASAAMRPLISARNGRIVAIGSVAAQYGTSGNSAYAATKGAMLGYVRTLAVEIARKGVTANYVAPGFIETGMLADYEPYFDRMAQRIPAGRLGRPEEIADMVAFLMSPSAAYLTGSVLTIDGGLTAHLISRRG